MRRASPCTCSTARRRTSLLSVTVCYCLLQASFTLHVLDGKEAHLAELVGDEAARHELVSSLAIHLGEPREDRLRLERVVRNRQ